MSAPDHADVALARTWASFYQLRGFQVLPSYPDRKQPMLRYADWWERKLPAGTVEQFETSNIQIMTGRAWRLLVIDIDGQEARIRWQRLCLGRVPATWVTHSGGDGWHIWFRLPENYPVPLPKAVLWKSPNACHDAIERLCDKSLVMAPPSIHPDTGRRYRFLDRYHSPELVPMPAPCPSWVLKLEPIGAKSEAAYTHARPTFFGPITGLESMIQSWGVRIAGKANSRGWIPCHAIDREDKRPSAAIHSETGYYVDLGSGLRLSIYDLAVRLGVYLDHDEAVKAIRPLRTA